ncbi:hypothetical protein MMC08_005686 [Hypocenomyce scalaris]|nr:hypothetical protein [Hypocenomyce scalaris]
MADTVETPYTTLPLTGPHDVAVGHALITLVEPHVGHERAYNRWYENDHIFTGALFQPWVFSGRRWVATYDLQRLRYPKTGSPIAEPITKGCYLGTYWITPGRLDDVRAWAYSSYERLVAESRVNDDRDHVYTSFQTKAFTVYRDPSVPNEVFTLMDPPAGLVLEILDSNSAESRGDFERWLSTKHLPSRLTGDSPFSSVMVFRTLGPDPNIKPEVQQRVAKVSMVSSDLCRLTVLWFLTKSPHEVWDSFFLPEAGLVESGGFGTVSMLAPFIPSKMGTDTYVDQLRAPAVLE